MAVYYFDTSALVKRYAREAGTPWVTTVADPLQGNDLYTVRLTGPEMISALFRKVRMKEISRNLASRPGQNFRLDWRHQYQIVEVSARLADRAMNLTETHALRAYDAVHLAAAVELHTLRRAMQLSDLVFVSADDHQLNAAGAEGLQTDNPSNHL